MREREWDKGVRGVGEVGRWRGISEGQVQVREQGR